MASSARKTGTLGIAYAATQTTDATTGMVAFAFPAGTFMAPPIVTASAIDTAGDGRDILVTIVGVPTATSCTVLARKSRTVSTTSSLQAYDIFAPVAAPVHLHARAAS